MSSKLICFWGSPGSGKTICSLAVAAKLAAMKKNVYIVNCDKVVPMLKVYVPSAELNAKHSIGSVLLSNNYNDEVLSSKMINHPDSEYLFFLGLAPCDTYITYPDFERSSILKLINKLLSNSDYVIVDGVSNPLNDIMTMTCLEIADNTVQTMTPDPKGLVFTNSYKKLFQEDKFKFDTHIKVLNNIKEISPMTEIIQVSGNYDFYIPYSYEAESKYIGGELIQKLNRTSGLDFEMEIKELTERLITNER